MADWKMIADLGMIITEANKTGYSVEVVESPSGKSYRGKVWEMYMDADGDWAYTRRGLTFKASPEAVKALIEKLGAMLKVVEKLEEAKNTPVSTPAGNTEKKKGNVETPNKVTLPGLGEIELTQELALALASVINGQAPAGTTTSRKKKKS